MRLLKAFLTLALAVSALTAHAQGEGSNQALSEGEYLARLGNCAACHTIDGGEPFAGGLKMAVPMLGAIYTTNITPDPETGIGDYTFEDFDRSMRLGIAKDGHRLYPAMPYPSYAKISEADMQAMYDFFMNEVEPVKQANLENEIPGWMSARWPLAVWNFFVLDDDRYEVDESKDEAWNRGAYLTQGLGHCGACHTPRGILFQEKGLDESDSDFLAGAPLDHWSASPLNGDINSGLGRWTEDDVVQFLKIGKNRWGSAFGTMVEVVNNSTQYMTDEDLHAMAVYLKSLPAVREKDEAEWVYDATSAENLANFNFEERGAQVYYEYCVSCHLYDGSGHGEFLPPLAGNPVVLDPDPSSLINLTLNGSLRVVIGDEPETYDMPYFRGLLNDEQIADVVSFMRGAWGHNRSPIEAEQVTEIREATDPINNDIVILKMK
ncbi:MAG: cytochrome c [Cellvibrionaceae bacterium]